MERDILSTSIGYTNILYLCVFAGSVPIYAWLFLDWFILCDFGNGPDHVHVHWFKYRELLPANRLQLVDPCRHVHAIDLIVGFTLHWAPQII